jgi:CheY-like chemotaxis protein
MPTWRSSKETEPAVEPRRILVVDDNLDAAESLALVLQFMGHDVRTAFDGLGAIDAYREFAPDVMLLDIGLPGLNGYDVARQIRAEGNGKSARLLLVALTGWGQEDDVRRSSEAGFDIHMVKPVSISVLRRLLADSVAS